MSTHAAASDVTSAGFPLVIEVEGYEGEDGSIVVWNDRAARGRGFGVSEKLYCIGAVGADGVVRFNDWGYATAEEARAALNAL